MTNIFMKRKQLLLLLAGIVYLCNAQAQQKIPRSLPAKRTTATFKIDGSLDEPAWKEATPAKDFVEWRPNFGAAEDPGTGTEVYLLYDNTSIYIGGYCHERSKDSVSKELVGRDKIGVNDYLGVIFDTYNDKINGFGFYLTPLGEQYDAKYSNTVGEDDSWNAVWDGQAKLVADGWTFEMRIPYSAIRFVSKDNQTWGLNITRNRKKAGRQFMWNPVDPKVNGFMNQSGEWTNIEKIKAPTRLSFSPYFSTYLNHYPNDEKGTKDWTSSVNGGMDVKYGISDAFTLDMTLIPDFGQVQSDNQVLNLSPFETKFTENRPFFTEGTELFSKGNLFYSRRVGGTPLHLYDAYDDLGPNEEVIKNPVESKLINATKISGRTKKGFGLGIFNAISKNTYATIEDTLSGTSRKFRTAPLTNYNIVVFDQTLKNNSAISFINTNVLRSGSDPDANVSAAMFDLNNKKNTYNVNGKVSISQQLSQGHNQVGYSHYLAVNKTGGRFNFTVSQELADDKYDINDMGILYNNNYLDHYTWMAYRWLKPKNWYKQIQVNFNAYYSLLDKKIPGQVVDTKFQTFNTNVNGNAQLKNLWWIGMYIGYVAPSNDFYEPRVQGRSWKSGQRFQVNPWFETNSTKKYYFSFNYFLGLRQQFHSPNHEFYLSHRYRFSDRFSISHDLNFSITKNDAGFFTTYNDDVLFSRRNLNTVENVLSFKYSFNNKSGITLRARHYWSKVDVQQLYDLQLNGDLTPTHYNSTQVPLKNQCYNIFNIDAVYTLQFAPGSFINIVWKDESQTTDAVFARYRYFKNFNQTIQSPQNNNLSIKIIYYLDYLDFKKWRRK